jgi:hypothetical protein
MAAKRLNNNSNGRFGSGSEDGSRIHSSGPSAEYSSLMPEILTDGKAREVPPTEYLAPQHRNFDNTRYGTNLHPFSMDDVDRDSSPFGQLGIEVLQSRIMGVDDFQPPANRSTSTTSRPPNPPVKKSSGQRS